MNFPDASPVKGRPVRLEPWAPGARPMISTRASGSPKPGTGLPQYSQSRYAWRFSRATCSRYATRRGQRVQAMTSRLRTVSQLGVLSFNVLLVAIVQANESFRGISGLGPRARGGFR